MICHQQGTSIDIASGVEAAATCQTAPLPHLRAFPAAQPPSQARYQSKYLAGDRSFAYGFTELTVTEAIEAGADLVSFINYPSGFDASGLLALQPVGSPALSKRSVESTLEFLQLLMTSQSQKYSSQEEWDQDLKPKEEALIKAVGNLVND